MALAAMPEITPRSSIRMKPWSRAPATVDALAPRVAGSDVERLKVAKVRSMIRYLRPARRLARHDGGDDAA
jgi:hypothetical protein